MKRMQREQTLTKEEKTFFDYKLIFYNLMNDPKLVALIKAEDDEEKNIIIDAIKKKKPIPEEILNKNNKIVDFFSKIYNISIYITGVNNESSNRVYCYF